LKIAPNGAGWLARGNTTLKSRRAGHPRSPAISWHARCDRSYDWSANRINPTARTFFSRACKNHVANEGSNLTTNPSRWLPHCLGVETIFYQSPILARICTTGKQYAAATLSRSDSAGDDAGDDTRSPHRAQLGQRKKPMQALPASPQATSKSHLLLDATKNDAPGVPPPKVSWSAHNDYY